MDPVILALGAYLLLSKKRQSPVMGTTDNGPSVPTLFAYLYQLPEDGFTTTRMAVGERPEIAQEMGIFGSPDAAARVASEKGYKLAWSGVRQIQTRPGG